MFSLIFLSNYGLSLLAIAIVCYVACGVIYRLYFSPLAKFPGPNLAAATFLFEVYYDVIKRGKYHNEITKMHQRYGPIVRVTPDELHIDDPDYYDELYGGPGTRRDKSEVFFRALGRNRSTHSTVRHDVHRIRRAALNPFFSKRAVVRLEGVIQPLVDKLCSRVQEFRKSKELLNLNYAFAALTTDVITLYCFGKSYDDLGKPEFAEQMCKTVLDFGEMILTMKHAPWIMTIMQSLPDWLTIKLNGQMKVVIDMQNDLMCRIQVIIKTQDEVDHKVDHPTLFHSLLKSDLDPSEKEAQRLVDEGMTLITAGVHTTAACLTYIIYHITSNPPILEQLRAELNQAFPDMDINPPLQKLEQLPYLTAVIQEGLRINHGVSHRLPRSSSGAPLIYTSWTIPAGTPVSMSAPDIHNNPDIFPEPLVFKPERWLESKDGQRLDRYLVAFSKGTRACVGINLAYAEMYLALAMVVRNFRFELYETNERDVEFVSDLFIPVPGFESQGVRVLVK